MHKKLTFTFSLVVTYFLLLSTAYGEYPSYDTSNNLNLGMSIEEVQQRVPGLKAVDAKNNFEAPLVKLGEDSYEVSMHFDAENKLVLIGYMLDIKDRKFKESYLLYTKIGKEIANMYNEPATKSSTIFSPKPEDQSFLEEWNTGPTTITLFLNYFIAKNKIYITYDSRKVESNFKPTQKKQITRSESSITPLFAEIPWYTNKTQVKKRLVELGYKFDEEKSNTWVHNLSDASYAKFEGTIAGITSKIYAIFDDQEMLIRFIVKIPSNTDYLSLYNSTCSDLTTKYGAPKSKHESYDYPFKKNDGHLDLAIKSNKANFLTTWSKGTNNLHLSIDEEPNVVLIYESRAFRDFLEFKEKNTKKDL